MRNYRVIMSIIAGFIYEIDNPTFSHVEKKKPFSSSWEAPKIFVYLPCSSFIQALPIHKGTNPRKKQTNTNRNQKRNRCDDLFFFKYS